MNSIQSNLFLYLLELASQNKNHPTLHADLNTFLSILVKDPDTNINQLLNSQVPALKEIINLFHRLETSNEDLARELLNCYEQLNTAFSTITHVARCKTIRQILAALSQEISQAIHSSMDLYQGPFIVEFSLPPKQIDPDKNLVYCLSGGKNIEKARQFFSRYESELQEMFQTDSDRLVRMVGHPTDTDSEGKGNVLLLRLSSREELSACYGILVFVRSNQQSPFDAGDMNLGASLVQMGAAVMENIISSRKLQEASIQTIASLVKATEAKDAYTSGHSARVSELACNLGRYLALDAPQIKILEWAGLLHDIGKIGIKDEVLTKPGKLTQEEFTHLKTHPVKSYDVLKPVQALQDILMAVKHHHEHFDGGGYPDGLKGDQIPLSARILQIADVWDALTSHRSYRAAMSVEKARQIMCAEAGTTMDPELVKNFLDMLSLDSTIKN